MDDVCQVSADDTTTLPETVPSAIAMKMKVVVSEMS